MNTPLEELLSEIVLKQVKGSIYLVPAITDLMVEEYIQKESSRIEEIVIGFSKWCEENGWSWSIDHQLYLHYDGKSLGKTDRELFKDYMESLKP